MMRRIKTKFAGLFIFGSLSCLTTVQAAVIYVDKDKPAPVRALQIVRTAISRLPSMLRVPEMSFAFGILQPHMMRERWRRGRELRRLPITVEPDVGHHPKLRYSGRNAQTGVIEIRDADYWRIRDLTFDGSERRLRGMPFSCTHIPAILPAIELFRTPSATGAAPAKTPKAPLL